MKADELVTRGVLAEELRRHHERIRDQVLEMVAAPPSPIVDTAGAAALLGVCTKTVLNMIDRGELRAVRLGSGWRLRRADVLAYFDDRLNEAS